MALSIRQDQTLTSDPSTAMGASETSETAADNFCVVNFYHLATVEEPEKVASAHKAWLEGSDVHGRIYISSQGINAQYSGPESEAVDYAKWVQSQQPFKGLKWSVAATSEHAFPRLRVAPRASLVSLAGGTEDLPITDASQRATPLSPAAWKDMLRFARPISSATQSRITGTVGSSNETRESKGSWRSLGDIPRQGSSSPLSPGAATAGSRHGGGAHNACDDASGNDSSGRLDPPAACSACDTEPRGSRNNPGTAGGMHDSKEVRVNRGDGTQHDQRSSDDSAALDGQSEARSRKDVVVLDVRNGYEWDAGHFQGAARPNEATFSETPTQAAAAEGRLPQELQHCGSDTPVMMYCTGGIRCDIYSTYLRKQGFTNLYTLEGGVHAYLKEEGGASWNGSLFVFDDRLAVPAGQPGSSDAPTAEEPAPSSSSAAEGLPAAVVCQLCSGRAAVLPHLNCANIDCSRLFVACSNCKSQLDGCCCEACRTEGRLVRPNVGGTTSVFRNASSMFSSKELHSLSSGRGEGRLRRRRAYEARIREKHRLLKEQRIQQRLAVKAAMAARGLAPDVEIQASGRHRQAASHELHQTD